MIFSLSLNSASYADVATKTPPDHEAQAKTLSLTTAVKTLDWIDLLPPNIDRAALMEHYADLVIQRLDPPDDPSLQEKIITEFKQAPANPKLDGVRIRLAGYMIVLDDREGTITEFLLVPYSGAGVHQPAPPANQILLVRIKPEQALAAEQGYEAVWVEGKLKLQNNTTSIASVAYLLEEAQVHVYTAEDAKQADAQHIEHEHEHEDEHTHAD